MGKSSSSSQVKATKALARGRVRVFLERVFLQGFVEAVTSAVMYARSALPTFIWKLKYDETPVASVAIWSCISGNMLFSNCVASFEHIKGLFVATWHV